MLVVVGRKGDTTKEEPSSCVTLTKMCTMVVYRQTERMGNILCIVSRTQQTVIGTGCFWFSEDTITFLDYKSKFYGLFLRIS